MVNGKGSGIGVIVRDNNVEKAIQIFKKRIKNSKILVEYKERMQFTKPSEKRRKARKISKMRSKKYENVTKY